ncbi:MAG: hypothetical protein IPF47_17900 [Gemmatimonadetes bacterium]|nr:hypothetical protein [Gemmatimonadota bacterium]
MGAADATLAAARGREVSQPVDGAVIRGALRSPPVREARHAASVRLAALQ